jgi:23S rRNA pseudouridine1911/1915/1917 synthase
MKVDVPPEAAGERLDHFLAGPLGSRTRAQRLIDAAAVLVDGAPRPKRHRLAGGERIEIEEDEPEDASEAAAVAAFAVVHEDDDLLVVDKPAGVVVHPAPGHRQGTLVQALADRVAGGEDPERAGIVHRLDRDTSGLLAVARTATAFDALKAAIMRREVEREYLALVVGTPGSRTGTIDAAIGRDRSNRTVMSTRTDKPRRAVTHFEILEELPGRSLLRVKLDTGRTHQIRAHMAAIGHPVCGDQAYGGRGGGLPIGLTRQFLHSARLVFSHPVSRESIDCESKPPADLHRALDAARRGSAPGGPDGS